MITFTMHKAILQVLHSKLLENNDVITITKQDIEDATARNVTWADQYAALLHDVNDTVMDALDILWKESFNDDKIKFAYETLMPLVMVHYNKSDVAKLECFHELKLSLELYASIVGNTGHTMSRETAKDLYERADAVLRKINSYNC